LKDAGLSTEEITGWTPWRTVTTNSTLEPGLAPRLDNVAVAERLRGA